MNLWFFPLFALAQASCYDYEYYDPVTQASVPGNACAKQATTGITTSVGQPQTFGVQTLSTQPTFSTQTTFASQPAFATTTFASQPAFPPAPITAPTYGVPAATYTSAPAFASAPIAPAPVFSSAPVYSSAPVLSAPAPIYGTPAPVYGTVAARLPVATTVARTVAAPQAVVVNARATASAPARPSSQLSSELEYYKELGERQARQHKQNARAVKEASEDLSRSSLFNRVIAGSGNAAPWYPAVRLEAQKDAADAYKSEKRIANKNAEDAYQRYVKDPSRLNLLVSKYQDLNADLRDAAYHYNVVNSATFGQRLATNSLFGSIGGGLFGGLTQVITQKQQSEDLTDIQRDMQRVARQIQAEARLAIQQRSGGSAQAQGSVQQRMMAMSVYGPQRG